ncbi:MAG TPA: YihY/virulence factor BrkB family protein [Gammaproteobacteria bacterium]|nr:YihY/virulence factor BrkB family protein [Gammaproteobacteria bacterium]
MKETLRARFEGFLWGHPAAAESRLRRFMRMPARFIYALARDLAEGQLTLRAMGLVYTTLLSLVPLLAFSFSVLKGFGVHREIEPLLYEFLQPLGEQGAEITSQVISFVDNVRGGVLGGIGLALLLFTVISMVHKVEDTFNYIWQVQKARNLARRFSDYLSVILIGPVLMVTAMGLLATISSTAVMQAIADVEQLGILLTLIGRLAPFVVVVLVFAFVYAFVPNTRVRLGPALVGAVLAGAAWTLGGSLFASVIVGSTRYAAIYSSFAIAVIALVWLYLSWLVLLIGAQISFYFQNPQRLRRGRNELKLSIAQVERLALGIMLTVGAGFHRGDRPDFPRLAQALDCPARPLEEITSRLEEAGLLARTDDEAFVPGRDPQTIELAGILAAVRGTDQGVGPVAGIVSEIRAAEAERLAGRSLADLVAGDGHSSDK